MHDRIKDQFGFLLQPLGLGQFEAVADAVAALLHVVGDQAPLLGVEQHLNHVAGVQVRQSLQRGEAQRGWLVRGVGSHVCISRTALAGRCAGG